MRLHSHGARVTLFDDRASLGGRARSDVLDGWTIDIGAQLIASSYHRTLAMLQGGDQDGTSRLQRMPGRDVFLRDGAAYPINFGSLRSLLSFGALGAADKVKLGLHLVPLLAKHRSALRADAAQIPAALDKDSAGQFIRTSVSAAAAEAIVEPIAATFCGARGDEISLGFYLTLGQYGSDGDVLAARSGWTAALDAATAPFEVERTTRIVALEVEGETLHARSDDGRSWTGAAAVIATEAPMAATLLAGTADAALIEWLRAIRYTPSLTVAASVGEPLRRDAFGVLVHNDGRFPVSALAVHGAKQHEGQPTGDLVLAWPTPDAAERLIERSPGDIASAIVPSIETLLPATANRIGRVRVYRHPLGAPLPAPGFAGDRARGRALAGAIAAPVALAGDYLTMPLLEGAVASGETAADGLLARFR